MAKKEKKPVILSMDGKEYTEDDLNGNEKAIEARTLREYPFWRTVSVGLDRHGAHPVAVQRNSESDLIGTGVNHLDGRLIHRIRVFGESGDHVLIVLGHIDIVYAEVHRNGLYDLVGVHIDDLKVSRVSDTNIKLSISLVDN